MTDYVSSTERVQVRLDGAALHIVFTNLARHNALSVDMWGAVPPLLKQAAADERVRVVVFSGAGEKAFVSGADISQFEDQRAAKEAVKHYEALAEDALMSISASPSRPSPRSAAGASAAASTWRSAATSGWRRATPCSASLLRAWVWATATRH